MATLQGGGDIGAATTEFNLDEGGGIGPSLPRLPVTPPFIFKYHPARWQVLRGRVVPLLGKLKLVDGGNGVTIDRDSGRPSLATAKAMLESQGWALIPLKATQDGKSYCVRVQGSAIHVERWAKTFPGSDKIQSDDKAYVEWLCWLREERIIPPPASYTIEALISKYTDQLSKILAKGRPLEGTEQYADARRATDAIEVLERELAEAIKRETGGQPAEAEDVDDLDSEES
jgi:hypothetical protein